MKYLYHVAVGPGLNYDCVAEDSLELRLGDTVVLECERYQDIGLVTGCADDAPADLAEMERKRSTQARGRQVEGHRVPEVIRKASNEDLHRAADNEERSLSMQQQARERIAAHGLNMKLIHTHCSQDRRLAVFQFCAEGRVDFRELLRDLSHQFRMRVELRQVGVRDEAAIQGGIGPCGRAFCCSTFLRQFKSINVKMAKMQGLSLNPANISGACARLKCCLEYEAEQYREEYQKARARAREARQESGSRERDDSRDRRAAGNSRSGGPGEGRTGGGRDSRNRQRRRPEENRDGDANRARPASGGGQAGGGAEGAQPDRQQQSGRRSGGRRSERPQRDRDQPRKPETGEGQGSKPD